MANQLPVKKGISAPAVTNIPEKWDRTWFRNFITNFLVNADIRNVKTGPGVIITGNVSGNATTGSSTTSSNTAVTLGSEPIANDTVLGNVSGKTAEPVALSQTDLTSLVKTFNTALSGAVPASGSGTAVDFLSALGQFTTIPVFTSTLSGAVPASGGGTVKFLRADGTFATPATGTSANPSALVGPSAVNGTAITFMTSDSAPGINLGGTYTWTALHTFNGGLAATTINATSDPRLKEKIHKIVGSSQIVDGLNGYRYRWKDSGEASLGVLSSEVKLVAPELIAQVNDHEAVNYNGLVAVLIEEVKALRQRVACLELAS